MTPAPGTLVYDGDCGFCTTSARLVDRLAPQVDCVAWQLTDLTTLGLTPEEAAARVQFVHGDGTAVSGAAAVAAVLVVAGGVWGLLGRVLGLPVVRTVAEAAYRLVARNRYRLPGGTPACRLP